MVPATIVNWLIKNAKKTPYFHLPGYMERYWLLSPRRWFPFSIRIHHILRSDDDRHLHDHPWSYLTVILKGGYWEETSTGPVRWYGPGSILYRRHNHFHRLTLPTGQTTWTMFTLIGKRKQTWGFKIPYTEYLSPEQVAEAREQYKIFGIE